MPPKTQSFAQLREAAKNASSSRDSSRARRQGRLDALPDARIVLGIDPGLHRTGYGLIKNEGTMRYLACGVIKARADAPLPLRLESLFDGLCDLVKQHRPDMVVIEELFSTYAHPRSALLMAHARGVLLLAAQQASVPVHSFLPNEVKQVIAGDGHASKAAMQTAVKSRLGLSEVPEPHDAADALALALCFALRQNLPRALRT
jgi:crossover junction endodeoxyribonuclease RuvC